MKTIKLDQISLQFNINETVDSESRSNDRFMSYPSFALIIYIHI